MMDEQATRFAVLLEDVDRKVGVLAESVGTLAGKVAEMDRTFSRRFDELDVKFVGMTIEMRDLKAEVGKLGGKVDKLEAFATDAAPRLVRIETHLALPALSPRRETTRPVPSKHHRRKPRKRT